MVVVNLFGGPGCGKSTIASEIYYHLKRKNVNCELVTEFAKDLVWDNSEALYDQLYLLGMQAHRLNRLDNKVDVAIVDSPLLLNIIYNRNYRANYTIFDNFVCDYFNSYNNINFVLKRLPKHIKPYCVVGRKETENEAAQKDREIIELLDCLKVKYTLCEKNNINTIISNIIDNVI